jgi:hypothetical protein
MSGLGADQSLWNLVRRLDISGVQNQTVRLEKPDTPVLTG